MDRASLLPGIPIPRKRQQFQELARVHPSAIRRRGAAVRPEYAVQKADQPSGRFRFGVFEADLGTGQLLKQGRRLRLQEQPSRLLVVLLERPGELVTREELHRLLWPRTTIDFDHGLNKAVSKLRDALGDSAESPRFVETVARRGYRFLADVAVLGAEVMHPAPVEVAPAGRPRRSPLPAGTLPRSPYGASSAVRDCRRDRTAL